jgi:membrane fusion protein (multidrug efflux system)
MLGLLLALSACGGAEQGGRERAVPLVKVDVPEVREFADLIEAVGTARANEQVTIASPVAERIERLYFDDGAFVRRGQLIAVLDQGQEQAALASALATEAQALSQLERIEALSERGFATQAQLDVQVAARARARADADDARARIADRTVRAPLTGAVSLRTISAGSIVSVGDAIATVSDLSRIKLDFAVPETALAALRTGQSIAVRAAAYPGEPFSGVIASIDPVLDPSTRSIMVRAILPNPDARLKPGMLLEVTVRSGERSAMAVPELAVVGEGEERFVYVVDAEGKARRTKVTTGLRDAGFIEVQGLAANARVVSEGVIKLSDGAQVRIEEPRAQAAGTPAKVGG